MRLPAKHDVDCKPARVTTHWRSQVAGWGIYRSSENSAELRHDDRNAPARVLVLSRSYPNNVFERSVFGCNVLSCGVRSIATSQSSHPCPISPVNAFPEYSRFRNVARQKREGRVDVYHPRFFVGPGRLLYHTEAFSTIWASED